MTVFSYYAKEGNETITGMAVVLGDLELKKTPPAVVFEARNRLVSDIEESLRCFAQYLKDSEDGPSSDEKP